MQFTDDVNWDTAGVIAMDFLLFVTPVCSCRLQESCRQSTGLSPASYARRRFFTYGQDWR